MRDVSLAINRGCNRWPDALVDRLADTARTVASLTPDWPDEPVEISLLLTDDAEMAALNREWRDKEGPTNVLSFPALDGLLDPDADGRPLGDIAIGLTIAETEAAEQDKSLSNHVLHLWVHGLLHLIGYDHIDDGDADEMETLEIKILAQLGIDDPYKGGEG